ncbi:nitroreductase family protein [Kurthia huakuii]|uniref:nitroreductase family protein n=1 Tax=Kurthia huakuii TaxID=1421019 RepID=UPI000495516E|nr:nitroreductase family protein [Kurthia huakuii]MBM7699703.1 putative NAD(P)H nitroreductase [Kurthia huakuii]
MEFTDLVKARRSANNFDAEVRISEAELKVIFDDTKLTPSAFNLQPVGYKVVMNDAKLQERMKIASGGQYKVGVCSAVIVVTTNTKAYEDTAILHAGAVQFGIMSESEVADEVQMTATYYEGQGEDFQYFDAVRNGSLSAMQFMLAAKNQGWDTCPVSYDDKLVRAALNLPDNEQVIFMIALGKEKTAHPRMRGYRRPVSEFVKIY